MKPPWKLYSEHAGAVRAYLRRRHPGVDADDVTQEVFLAASRGGAEQAVRPRAWLFQVARNVAATLSRRPRAAPLNFEPTAPMPADQMDALREAIHTLPDEMREALRLKLEEGLSYDEIAARQAVPIGTVRSRLHRAVAILRDKLKDEP